MNTSIPASSTHWIVGEKHINRPQPTKETIAAADRKTSHIQQPTKLFQRRYCRNPPACENDDDDGLRKRYAWFGPQRWSRWPFVESCDQYHLLWSFKMNPTFFWSHYQVIGWNVNNVFPCCRRIILLCTHTLHAANLWYHYHYSRTKKKIEASNPPTKT